MVFIPMLLILALIGVSWPSALPAALAYFLIGGMLGAGFHWAARRHPDKDMAGWAKPMALYVLYGWPMAIAGMFIFRTKVVK